MTETAQVTIEPFTIQGYIGTKTMGDVIKKKETLTHISLFTGIGGFDMGFHAAGFETRVMVEFNKSCCETLRANWLWSELRNRKGRDLLPLWKTKEEMKKEITWYQDREPVILERDIRTISTKEILEASELEIGECSIISGGPPCQGFSTANIKRMVDEPRNFAFKEFVRIVNEAKPRMIIMENVPGMVSTTKGRVIREICEEFAKCGYEIMWNIMDAANYGVPQYRRRVFIIGKRIDMMYFPEIGNPRLHMGIPPGKVIHPEWFVKKYKIDLKENESTHDEPIQDARRDRAKRKKNKKVG